MKFQFTLLISILSLLLFASYILLNYHKTSTAPLTSARFLENGEATSIGGQVSWQKEQQKENLQDQNLRTVKVQLYDFEKVWNAYRAPLWSNRVKYRNCENIPRKAFYRIKVLIIVTSLPGNNERRNIIRQSWASELNLAINSRKITFVVVFIIGKPTSKHKRSLAYEIKEHGDIIQADFQESYQNLTLKSQLSLDFAVHECRNFDYVIKTDDDMYVDITKIALFFSTEQKVEQIFGGKCYFNQIPDRSKESKWYVSEEEFPGKNYPPFCVGAFYLMSMEVAKEIHKQYRTVRPFFLEDVFHGFCLKNIPFTPNRILDVESDGLRIPEHWISDPDKNYAVHFGNAYQLIPQFHKALKIYGNKIKTFKIMKSKDGTFYAKADVIEERFATDQEQKIVTHYL